MSLQNPDGSFKGDCWGEIDTRFSYCAIASLSLLNHLSSLNKESAIKFIYSCRNFDGGFGNISGTESHAGQSNIDDYIFFISFISAFV